MSTLLRRNVSVALGLALVALGCRDLLLDVGETELPLVVAEAAGDRDPIGDFYIPVPVENTPNFGAVPWTSTGAAIPGGNIFVEVRVTGSISFAPPQQWCPEFARDDRLDGVTIGPKNSPTGEFIVGARLVRASNGTHYNIPLSTHPDSGNVATWIGELEPGYIEVNRSGGGSGCGYTGPPPVHHSGYLMSGAQLVQVSELEPFDISANPTLVQSGGTVAFGVNSPYTIDDQRWYWRAWDTLPTPAGLPSSGSECWYVSTCSRAVSQSGRMYLRARAGGVAHYVAASPVVRVLRPCTETGGEWNCTVVIESLNGQWTTYPAGMGHVDSLKLRAALVDEWGTPHPGASISTTLSGVSNSGGHSSHHGATPTGALAPTGPLTADATGWIYQTFHASVFGGDVAISASADSAETGDAEVTVTVPGLVALGSSTSIGLIGATSSHPSNHWATTDFISRIEEVAGLFYEQFSVPLEVNDLSLVNGGKFDLRESTQGGIDAAYFDSGGPHGEHRDGTTGDIRTYTHSARRLRFLRLQWERTGGQVYDETCTSQPHYHFRTVPGSQSSC